MDEEQRKQQIYAFTKQIERLKLEKSVYEARISAINSRIQKVILERSKLID